MDQVDVVGSVSLAIDLLIPDKGLIVETVLQLVEPLGRPVLKHGQVLQKQVLLGLLFHEQAQHEFLVFVTGHGGNDAILGADCGASTPIVFIDERAFTKRVTLEVNDGRFEPLCFKGFLLVSFRNHRVNGSIH